MKKKIFYSIATTVLLFTSCKKVDLGNVTWGGFSYPVLTYTTFDNNGLEIINLPLNRYFIYKDSATGFTDSVIVTESNITQITVPVNTTTPVYFYDTYTLKLTNFTSTGSQPWLKGFARCDSQYRSAPVSYDSDFHLFNEQTSLPAFWFPFISSGLNKYNFIPSLSIEGKTYTSVQMFFATNGLQPTNTNYLKTIFYWVKGTGIIKKEIRTFNSVKTSLLVRHG